MARKAIILLSGGIDSTTCFHIAKNEFGADNIGAILVDYGQRHKRELQHAKRTCSLHGVGYETVDLSSIIPKTMLTDASVTLPDSSYEDLGAGVSPTYVPFRNGLMLSAITSVFFGNMKNIGLISDAGGEEHALFFGAHAEDAQNWAYADCTPEFIGAMANVIYIGTYRSIRLHTPLQWMTKAEIIKLGSSLGVNWNDTWSCYSGKEWHCGTCPTCRARRAAFEAAGVTDPTKYISE